MSGHEEMRPPFHELPDGAYEIRFADNAKWWAPSRKEESTWKSPIGRFRAHA